MCTQKQNFMNRALKEGDHFEIIAHHNSYGIAFNSLIESWFFVRLDKDFNIIDQWEADKENVSNVFHMYFTTDKLHMELLDA